jgi:hypothetical protein
MTEKRAYRLGIILIGDREDLEEINSQLKNLIPERVDIIKQTLTTNILNFKEE